MIRDEFGRKGIKQNFTFALILMMLTGVFAFVLPTQAAADSWTDTTTENFALGTHENTENVDNNVRLENIGVGIYYTQGRFTSQVFDASAAVQSWDNISWSVTLGNLTVANVGAEPTVLIDGANQIGVLEAGTSYENTRVQDDIYENIQEDDVGTLTTTLQENAAYTENVRGENLSTPDKLNADDGDNYRVDAGYTPAAEDNLVENGDFTNDPATSGWENTVTDISANETGEALWDSTEGFVSGHALGRNDQWLILWYQDFSITTTRLDNAILKFAWRPAVVVSPGEMHIKVILKSPSTVETTIWEKDYNSDATADMAWTVQENTDLQSIINETGTWRLILQSELYTGNDFDGEWRWDWDNVTFEIQAKDTYALEVRHDSAPMSYSESLDNIRVRLNMTSENTATYTLQIYDWSTPGWNNLETVTINDGTEYTFDNTLTTKPQNYISPNDNIRVRLSTCEGNDHISKEDYLQFYVTYTPVDYRLNWEHRFTGVDNTYDNYDVIVVGYTNNLDENIGVYIWKESINDWEFIGNLPTTPGENLTYSITFDNINNYIWGADDNLSLRYFENNADNVTVTVAHIDYVVLEEQKPAETEIKFQVRVSSANPPTGDFLGPDGSTSTYFTTSSASLENIGNNQYFQYRAYLSSEDNTITPVLHEFTVATLENEIVEQRTADSKTWALGNNKYKTTISSKPIHYYESGVWKDIDLNLIDVPENHPLYAEGYRKYTEKNTFVIATKPDIISENFLYILPRLDNGDYGEYYLKVILAGMGYLDNENNYEIFENTNSVTGVVENNEELFENVFSETNFKYTAQARMLKEQIIFKDPSVLPDPENMGFNENTTWVVWSFELDWGDLKVWNENNENADVDNVDAMGLFFGEALDDIKYLFPTGRAWDNSDNREHVSDVRYRLVHEGDRHLLLMGVEYSWLVSPELVYPLYIDPSTVIYPTSDGYIEYKKGAYNSVNTTSDELLVGEYQAGPNYSWYRAFIRFDVSSIPDSATIDNAEFWIYYKNSKGKGSGEGACELAHIEDIGSTLDSTDWDKPVLNDYGTFIGVTEFYNWYSMRVDNSITLTSDNVSYRLKDNEEDQDTSWWSWYFYSAEYVEFYPPFLVVSYTDAPTEWQLVETWTGTVSAPAQWQIVETWTGTVGAPVVVEWQLIETWTGTVKAPAAWQLIETWTGTVEAPAAWQLIESWTGVVKTVETVAVPSSSVDVLSLYWQTSTPFTVTATASDVDGYVKNVELWYRYSTNDLSWGPWTSFGLDNDNSDGWSWSFDAPEGDGYYEFHSIARDDDGNAEEASGAADVICGVDRAAPPAPNLVSPTSGTTTDVSAPTFDWSDVTDLSGVTYTFEIIDTLTKTGLTSSTYTLTSGEALPDGTYLWRVRAIDGAGNVGDWSETWSLTVSTYVPPPPPPPPSPPPPDTTPPPTPSLVSPADETRTEDNTSTFDWSDVTDPSGVTYTLEIIDTLTKTGLTSSTYTLTNTEALAEGTYSWRVRAVDGAGNIGNWSSTWSLTVTIPVPPGLPTSTVDTITPYWQTVVPFTVTATASDNDGYVTDVALYYRYSGDNSSWDNWTLFGVDRDEPWSWSFTASEGNGHYEFYSIAKDNDNNEESAPLRADAWSLVVRVAPIHQVTIGFIPGGGTGMADFTPHDIPLLAVTITTVENDENDVVVTVEMLENVEVSAPPGIVHSYERITLTNITHANIRGLLTMFRVSRSWVVLNDIDDDTIKLLRFSGNRWQELPTELVGTDANYLYLEASMEGFSLFAVTGESKEVVVPPPPFTPVFYALLTVFATLGGGAVAYVRWFRPITPSISLKRLKPAPMTLALAIPAGPLEPVPIVTRQTAPPLKRAALKEYLKRIAPRVKPDIPLEHLEGVVRPVEPAVPLEGLTRVSMALKSRKFSKRRGSKR